MARIALQTKTHKQIVKTHRSCASPGNQRTRTADNCAPTREISRSTRELYCGTGEAYWGRENRFGRAARHMLSTRVSSIYADLPDASLQTHRADEEPPHPPFRKHQSQTARPYITPPSMAFIMTCAMVARVTTPCGRTWRPSGSLTPLTTLLSMHQATLSLAQGLTSS